MALCHSYMHVRMGVCVRFYLLKCKHKCHGWWLACWRLIDHFGCHRAKEIGENRMQKCFCSEWKTVFEINETIFSLLFSWILLILIQFWPFALYLHLNEWQSKTLAQQMSLISSRDKDFIIRSFVQLFCMMSTWCPTLALNHIKW